MDRLRDRLELARQQRRLLLVGFLPAGYPEPKRYGECLRAAFEAGLGALEIALPSPPLPQDGPQLQQAARIAQDHINDPAEALRLTQSERTDLAQPLIVIAGRHALNQLGLLGLVGLSAANGIDALMFPDLPLSEQIRMHPSLRSAGLEQVLFVPDTSLPLPGWTGEQLRPIIYLPSAAVRTGGQFDSNQAKRRLDALRATELGGPAYVVVGFGIRGPSEIAALAAYPEVDGVVVGTAVANAAMSGGPPAVRELIDSMNAATARSSGILCGR